MDEITPLFPRRNPRLKKILISLFIILAFIISIIATFCVIFFYHKNPEIPLIPITLIPNITELYPVPNITRLENPIDFGAKKIIQTYCPFRDMNSLSPFCENNYSDLNQEDSNLNQDSDLSLYPKLPIFTGLGWDPVEGEIKLPFLEISFLNKTVISINGTEYLIPDQQLIEIYDPNIIHQSFNYFANFYQLMDQYTFTRTDVTNGVFALPVDVLNQFVGHFDGANSYLTWAFEYRTSYSLQYKNSNNNNHDNFKPSQFAQNIIDSLPEEYDPELYSLFIKYFGTKIVLNGNVGLSASQIGMVKQCYGTVDLNSQTLHMLKAFYPDQYNHVSFAGGYQERSKVDLITMYGGNPAYPDPSQWRERVQTVNQYPVFTHVSTVDITTFVTDPIKKANIQKAIDTQYSQGNELIESFKIAFQNLMNQPKTYFGIMTDEQINLNTYDHILSFSQTYPNAAFWYSTQVGTPYSNCKFDDANTVTSVHNPSTPYLIQYQDGQKVYNYGCSGASILENHADKIFLHTGWCCINCNPRIVPKSDGLHFYGDCDCPIF